MNPDELLSLHALVDGELDAISQRALEKRLAVEPELAAEYERLTTLRHALRRIPTLKAPDDLRAQIERLGKAQPIAPLARLPAATHRRTYSVSSWGAIAATVATLAVGLGTGWVVGNQAQLGDPESRIVEAHIRGLVASRPVDIVSTDQHTVKPWFAGKLTIAPVVVDLTTSGFPLEGGRIDMVDGVAEPTLVYRHGAHTISVTRMPTGGIGLDALKPRRSIDGHSTLAWQSGGQRYFAVSDAAPAELDALRDAFDKAVAAGG